MNLNAIINLSKLNNNNQINNLQIGGTQITDFETKINLILDALFIKDPNKRKQIIDAMNKFNDSEKYKLINDTQINELVEKDAELGTLHEKILKNFPDISDQWYKLMENLAKLQTFILLQKIEPTNCQPIISEIINALNNKITTVNNILEEKLNSNTQKKYLKYKSKYFHLKNNI